MSVDLHYLAIIDQADKPLLFKSYKSCQDMLNIQLHCYASLDFIEQKLQAKPQQYLGKIYTIYNNEGEYSIYAFCTVTKLKILTIFKQEHLSRQIVEDEVNKFCDNVYKLYKKQILQAFSQFQKAGRFNEKFYEQLDSYVSKTKFAVTEKVEKAEKGK